MHGGIPTLPARFICTLDGAPLQRCECCLRSARQTVIFERSSGRRIHVAACNRHANMAERELRRFLVHRANRDKHFAAEMAAMGARESR